MKPLQTNNFLQENMLIFDTHQIVKNFINAGFTEQQAEAVTNEQKRIIESNLANKKDIAEVKKEIKEVDAKLTKEITEVKRDIAEVKKELKEVDAKLTRELKEVDAKLTRELKEIDAKLTKELKEVDAKLTKELKEVDAKLTKEITEVKRDIAEVKKEIKEVEAKLTREIAQLGIDFKKDILIQQNKIIFRLGSVIVIGIGVLATLIKFF